MNQSGIWIGPCPNYNLLFNLITDFCYKFCSQVGFKSSYLGIRSSITSTGDIISSITGSAFSSATAGTTVIETLNAQRILAAKSGLLI